MSGTWTEEDLRSTIPFEEIDVHEDEDTNADDLLSALPDDPPIEPLEGTVARMAPQIAEERPTRAKAQWDLTPPLRSTKRRQNPERVHDEVTAVRSGPARREDTQWIDVRASVDDEGRLQLPVRIAERLKKGSVVEIRIARWAVPDS